MGRAAGRKNLPREPQLSEEPVPGAKGREIGESARQDPAGSPIPGLTGNIVNYPTVRQDVPVGESLDEFRGIMAHGVPNASEHTEERARMERDGTLAQHGPPSPPQYEQQPEAPRPVPVYLTTLDAGGKPLGTMATAKLSIPASTGNDPVRIASRDFDRTAMYVMVETAAGSTSSSVVTPGTVPATGVAQQNTNAFPVSVAIAANGATISAVVVNGVTVGTAAGTYTVPAYGAISVSYTVATPTWVWTGIGNVTSTAPSGIRIDKMMSNVSAGIGALIRAGGSSYQKLDNFQDELFALSNDGSAVTLSVMYLFSAEAAD